MREAQPGGEVPLHAVVVAADRHGAMRGRYIYRRRRARGPRKKAGRRRRGLRWRRRSTGGTIGFGFEGWESEAGGIDGTATAAAFGGRGAATAARTERNGAEERNPIDRITQRDARGTNENGREIRDGVVRPARFLRCCCCLAVVSCALDLWWVCVIE
jgi:hypothetical protein